MSLHSNNIPPVPQETVRIARAAFPKGNLYLKMRDELGTLFTDEQFADLFSHEGQPALPPWRLGPGDPDAVCRRTFRPAGCRSGTEPH